MKKDNANLYLLVGIRSACVMLLLVGIVKLVMVFLGLGFDPLPFVNNEYQVAGYFLLFSLFAEWARKQQLQHAPINVSNTEH